MSLLVDVMRCRECVRRHVYVAGVRPTAAPSITIADMNDFDADTYPDRLDAWCRAALSMWETNE